MSGNIVLWGWKIATLPPVCSAPTKTVEYLFLMKTIYYSTWVGGNKDKLARWRSLITTNPRLCFLIKNNKWGRHAYLPSFLIIYLCGNIVYICYIGKLSFRVFPGNFAWRNLKRVYVDLLLGGHLEVALWKFEYNLVWDRSGKSGYREGVVGRYDVTGDNGGNKLNTTICISPPTECSAG